MSELAGRQHGVVSRRQLLAAGFGRRAIEHRLSRRRLHPIHRCVYAVGHQALSQDGRWMAAALAGGDDAALGLWSGGAMWRLHPLHRRPVDVMVPRHMHSRPGLAFHCARLAPDEVTVLDGIPVTTVTRTLFDLAGVLRPRAWRKALNQADVQRLTDTLTLADMVDRHPHALGAPAVRRHLDRRQPSLQATRSDWEIDFICFLEDHDLPPAEINAEMWLGGRQYFIDALWAQQRLAVELDSERWHLTRQAFQDDRERDRRLAVAGFRVIRVTWLALEQQPHRIAADLRVLLAQPPPRRS